MTTKPHKRDSHHSTDPGPIQINTHGSQPLFQQLKLDDITVEIDSQKGSLCVASPLQQHRISSCQDPHVLTGSVVSQSPKEYLPSPDKHELAD